MSRDVISAIPQSTFQRIAPQPIQNAVKNIREGLFGYDPSTISMLDPRKEEGLVQAFNRMGLVGTIIGGFTKNRDQRVFEREQALAQTGYDKTEAAKIAQAMVPAITATDVLGKERQKKEWEERFGSVIKDEHRKATKVVEIFDVVDNVFAGIDALTLGTTKRARIPIEQFVKRLVQETTPKGTTAFIKSKMPQLGDEVIEKIASRTALETDDAGVARVLLEEANEQFKALEKSFGAATRAIDEIPAELQSLAQEARKYKSAEEFEKAMRKSTFTGNFDTRIGTADISLLPDTSTKIRSRDVVDKIKRFIQGEKQLGKELAEKTDRPMDKILKGFYERGDLPPIVVETKAANRPKFDEVVDGKHRLQALRELGVKEVPIAYVDEGGGINPTLGKTSQLTDFYNQAVKKGSEVVSTPATRAKQTPQETPRPQKEGAISPEKTVSPRRSSLQDTISDGKKEVKTNAGTPEEKLTASKEEIESIKDVLNKSEMRIRATSAKGTEKTSRNLAKEITDNVKKQNETLKDTEIAKLREKNLLGAETIDEIILRKRGIITDKEAIERAKSIRGTLDDVLNIPKGAVPTKEQMTAVAQIVQTEREVNKKLTQLIDGGGVAQSADERALISKLGEGFKGLDQHQILNRALAESTKKLKRAEIVLLGLRSEAGRTLQSAKIVAESVDSRMRIVFGKIRKLDPTEEQAMIEWIAKQDMKNDKQFIKVLEELNTADFFDKFAEWSTAVKLWNPTTHLVNLGGNTIRLLADVAITSVANPRAIKADIAGMRVGLSRGLKNAFRAMTDEGYASQLSKYIEEGGTAPSIGGKLGQWARTPFRMLGAGDEIFRAVGYQRSLYRQADTIARKEGLQGAGRARRMEELLGTPTLDMMESATEQSKRLTFQEDMDELTKSVNNFRTPSHFKAKTGKTMALVLRFFLPFLKTPTNLLKQSVDFSPLGGLKNYKKLKEAAKNGDTETVGRIVGESVVGTALMAYVVMETLDGNITGGAPREKSERDRFYRENKLPYAIKIGGRWYQYKRVDPFSTMMGLAADITNLATEEDVSIASLVNSFANQLSDKTYLQGIGDFMNLMTGEEWERERALNGMILGATLPSFIGHTARSIDPTVRQADTFVDRIHSQIPFTSKSLPARVNVLGEDVERANKGLNYFFNPIQSEVAEIDPITKHLMDIDKTIPLPQSHFTRDGVKYELTPEEYADYSKQVGTQIKDDIEKLMRLPSYNRLSTEKKEEKIDDIRKDAMDDWKDAHVKGSKRSLDTIFGALKNKTLDEIFKR